MNNVQLIGRLTKDVELRYTTSQTAVANVTLAVDKMSKEDGAYFIGVTGWGKQAENLQRYMGKGSLIAVEGHIETSDYEKDGRRVFKTDVIAERVQFLQARSAGPKEEPKEELIQDNFTILNEQIPF